MKKKNRLSKKAGGKTPVRDGGVAKVEPAPEIPKDWQVEDPEVVAPPRWVDIECPYCGEVFEISVDLSQEFASYSQSCQVCCKPIRLDVENDEGELHISASRC